MIYLLAKYTVLFLLTALFGFVLGYWFSRRNFVDVSESFEELRKASDVDLHPMRIELSSLRSAIEQLPAVETHAPVDIKPVIKKLGTLEQQVNTLSRPQSVDFAPVISKIGNLEQRVNTLPRPQRVNLAPFDQRLKTIEKELGKLGKRLEEPRSVEPAPRMASRKEPRVLKAAIYGDRDDLKRISGVGPKLEKLLNHNGVYYFWQVASWTSEDIDVIDDRLDVFKGRIARDNWVTQAQQLKEQPEAAQIPAE